MSTVASLPFFLFTLPAGALADKVDRQKLICAINVWLAATAVGLAAAWLAASAQSLPHLGLRVFHRSWICF